MDVQGLSLSGSRVQSQKNMNSKKDAQACAVAVLIVCCAAVLIVIAVARNASDNGSSLLNSNSQPTTTPALNFTTPPPDLLLEQKKCPSNETLNELFSRYTPKFSQIANRELLTRRVWTRLAIDQSVVSENCMKMNQPSCESVVKSFRERCESNRRYV